MELRASVYKNLKCPHAKLICCQSPYAISLVIQAPSVSKQHRNHFKYKFRGFVEGFILLQKHGMTSVAFFYVICSLVPADHGSLLHQVIDNGPMKPVFHVWYCSTEKIQKVLKPIRISIHPIHIEWYFHVSLL